MAFSTLAIDLTAKVAGFEEGMNKAVKSLDRVDKRAAAMSSSLKAAFGAISVGALASFVKSGIDAADALNDMSQRLGVSVKDLASFKLAAEQSGTSLDSVGVGIARLSKSIGEAELGNKNLAGALKQLGITAKDPKEAFFQLADAVQRIHDPTRRAALLSQVLGKSYNELVPMLKDGGDALRASAASSESFANSMAKLAPDADKFNDTLAELKQNAAGLAAELLTALVPALNEIMSRIVLVKNLIGQGGLFNTLNITAGTGEISTVLRRVKDDIVAVQGAIDRGKSSGKDTSGFEERLRGLNAQLAILKQYSRETALALGKGFENYKVPQTPGSDGKITTPSGGSAKSMRLDEIDPFHAQRTAAMKEQADEIKRFINEQQDAINGMNREMSQDGVAAAEAYASALASLLSGTDLAKTQGLYSNIEILNKAFFDGIIGIQQYDQAMKNLTEGTKETSKEMDTFAKTAAENIQNSFADFLFDPFDKGLKNMAESFGEMIRKMIAEAVAADLTRRLFGDLVSGGSGSGLVGGALSAFGKLMNFSGGGFTGSGSRSGGVDGIGGFLSVLHPNETVVDHTKGQRAGGHTIIVNVNGTSAPDVRRAAGQGAREALGMLNGAQRYA